MKNQKEIEELIKNLKGYEKQLSEEHTAYLAYAKNSKVQPPQAMIDILNVALKQLKENSYNKNK